ncbi:hypothetical protein B0T22DRAFT_372018 [Podospora appendiculata]|uniref:Uncharacterized protein n=1 Tax=Podospora appendiculata TaxID=314037 RepID=A0AAE0XHS2_9PEZI|nr:hypothetical protein B0T22DRAFT_372018 [Podospora appendiculata]
MAPIRRYLRITKYSVLECRIYLDNPALVQSWLLNPRNPVLPRVIESVRPLVLPKLREEQERQRSKKKSKKRSIKDVVIDDEFEVSIFLTETDTRHSLLHKRKLFRDKTQTKLTSNSSKLTGISRQEAIDVDVPLRQESPDEEDHVPVLIRREDDDDQDISLDDIPAMDETAPNQGSANRRPKRARQWPDAIDQQGQEPGRSSGRAEGDLHVHTTESESDASDDDLFVGGGEFHGVDSGDDSDDSDAGGGPPPRKRHKDKATAQDGEDGDDKKKLALDISYEGFAIYGRVLCLVVKRRDGPTKPGHSAALAGNKSQTGGQAMMENWITSTQLPEAGLAEDDAM